MKVKLMLRYLIQYISIILLCIVVLKITGYSDNLLKYIMLETANISFQDFLSITITILSIFVGAIITVATVLISMCDKRVLKLINKYKKSNHLVKTIKVAIGTGITAILLLGFVYSKLDFNILMIRLSCLLLSGFNLYIFIMRSRILVILILDILNDSFNDTDNSVVVNPKFVNKSKISNKNIKWKIK